MPARHPVSVTGGMYHETTITFPVDSPDVVDITVIAGDGPGARGFWIGNVIAGETLSLPAGKGNSSADGVADERIGSGASATCAQFAGGHPLIGYLIR